MKKYFKKPILTFPFWHNENIWYNIPDKINLKNKYNLDNNSFLIGSFQRDTEGAGISSGVYLPKKEKGPDIFISALLILKNKYPNIKVILSGWRRQYVIKELEKNNIPFYYYKMCSLQQLNELYNCLDLYIVGSRVEGGPRAINESSLTKTPLLSTDVGISNLLCHPTSIFDMNNIQTISNCKKILIIIITKRKNIVLKNYMKDFTNKLINNENNI